MFIRIGISVLFGLYSIQVSKCDKDTTIDVCHQPKEVGPCRALKPRFWYNQETKKCEDFSYGGCNGNDNNFLRESDCVAKCVEEKKDEEITKRTQDQDDQSDDALCHLPREVGKCRAAYPRFWYNDQTKKCERFIYGGCDGNKNNFVQEIDCEEKCVDKSKPVETFRTIDTHVDEDPCHLPKEVGPCRALKPRFYYNNETKMCEHFSYGGCQGNDNNFLKEIDCHAKCIDKKEDESKRKQDPIDDEVDFCHLAQEVGPCRALKPRFWFNHQDKKCEQFMYGGCNGNRNNFLRESDCMEACSEEKTTPNPDETTDGTRTHKDHDENNAQSYKSYLIIMLPSIIAHLIMRQFW
jgi:hypothetical protein